MAGAAKGFSVISAKDIKGCFVSNFISAGLTVTDIIE
jgi:hypothetical protein